MNWIPQEEIYGEFTWHKQLHRGKSFSSPPTSPAARKKHRRHKIAQSWNYCIAVAKSIPKSARICSSRRKKYALFFADVSLSSWLLTWFGQRIENWSKCRCIAVHWDQSAERAEVAALVPPHSGNHKTLETGITGSLVKAYRFACKILSSPRNRPRYNNENSLKTQKVVGRKSKTFSASSREPETTLRCYCKSVAKGAQEEGTCLHTLASHLLSQATAQYGRMPPISSCYRHLDSKGHLPCRHISKPFMPMVLNFQFFVYAPGRDLSPSVYRLLYWQFLSCVYSCIIGKTTQANANPNEYNTFACVLLASDMKCWANKIFNQSSNTGSVLPITWK